MLVVFLRLDKHRAPWGNKSYCDVDLGSLVRSCPGMCLPTGVFFWSVGCRTEIKAAFTPLAGCFPPATHLELLGSLRILYFPRLLPTTVTRERLGGDLLGHIA
jgi:hypothetical protein